ncbi:hypothetical protein BD626DRAFT_525437, partial [Schizophyllum amplum]
GETHGRNAGSGQRTRVPWAPSSAPGTTIVPLLPHTAHSRRISGEQHAALIQLGDDGVVKVRCGLSDALHSVRAHEAHERPPLLRNLDSVKGIVPEGLSRGRRSRARASTFSPRWASALASCRYCCIYVPYSLYVVPYCII